MRNAVFSQNNGTKNDSKPLHEEEESRTVETDISKAFNYIAQEPLPS